ncbi:MAG TPA: 6,7-dimethyl-8-ribityllumazine synthase [Acidimicrobiales bacterium]|nr:6,7-dimethyl-8-ribityllumazine synthase [Acidimicrobiales bacterium]
MTKSDELAFDKSMAESLRTRVGESLEGVAEGRGLRVALACSRFNGAVTLRLLDSALTTLSDAGVERGDVAIGWTPGAFELPLLAQAFATGPRRFDVVITLGAVIRGDTGHYEVVAGECARGAQSVQLATGVPIIFGVLTTNTTAQALERSRPDETNKGRESALAALEMVSLLRQGPLAR